MEQRVMLGLFGALPPADVQEDMVKALKAMCLSAAWTVQEESYVGPTEEQLDAIAEAAAQKLGTNNHSLWKIDYGGSIGIVRETPFKVMKIHQRFIKKGQEKYKTLKLQVLQMGKEIAELRAELNEQQSYTQFMEDEHVTTAHNFKTLVIALTALELKHDRRITALESQVADLADKYEGAIAGLAIRSTKKAKLLGYAPRGV